MTPQEPSIAIGTRRIATSEPCYIIAEIGVNHNGDLDLAHRMIDAAQAAGADAVKFQTFKTDAHILASAPKAEYQQRETGQGNQRDMVRKLELPFSDFVALKCHCDQIGIDFITTAFDRESLDFVIGLKPPCLKWASGEITNVSLLRQAARSNLPILVSTGMASLAEIDRALAIVRTKCSYAVLQCVSNYPARIEDQNLRVLPAFASAFGCPVGFSDHTVGSTAAIAARALGMSILEKHFTLDNALEGPDHAASMEPGAFAALVDALRAIERGLGDGVKMPVADEASTKAVARKSLVYATKLPVGHRVTEDDLIAKRPADGMGPEFLDLVIGQTLTRDVRPDEYVRLGDITEV